MRTMRVVAILLPTLLVAWPALAQSDALAEAETAVGEGDFERASALLESVTHEGRRSLGDVTHAYALLGVVHAARGEDAAARLAFDWALALDPDLAVPPELGPTQRALLEELRSARRGQGLSIRLAAPSDGSASQASTASASIAGAPAGEHVTVTMVAWPDDDELQGISAEGEGATRLTIPAGAWPDAHEIHVRAEARAGGPSLARRDASIARRGVTSSGGGGEVWQEAWFWVVIGVVVAGAVVGGVLAATLPQDNSLGAPQLVDHLP